jgi:hypothetical protein
MSTTFTIRTDAARTGAAYFARMVTAILDRGGPSNRDEQLRVWSRHEQIRDDPRYADETARLAVALKHAGVSILP